MWTAAYHRTARQDILSLSNLPAKRDKSISSSRSGNRGLPASLFLHLETCFYKTPNDLDGSWWICLANILIFSFYFFPFTIGLLCGLLHTLKPYLHFSHYFPTQVFCLLSVLFFILVIPLCFTPWLISFLISQHPPCLYFYHCKFNNHLLQIQEFSAEFSIRIIIIRYIKFL